MARPKNPNDKEIMDEIKEFFSQKFNRNHRRYTYIEFTEDKQQAIDRFKVKLLILKDNGRTFLKDCLNLDDILINQFLEEDPLMALSLAEAELIEDIKTKTIEIDPTLSNEEILKRIKEARNEQDFGKGLFQLSNEREFGSKLADTLYIIDCKKYYLSNNFIKEELDRYHGYSIRIDTIQKYFNYALEIYEDLET